MKLHGNSFEDFNPKEAEELKEAIAHIKTAQKYGYSTPDYEDDPEIILEWYRRCI